MTEAMPIQDLTKANGVAFEVTFDPVSADRCATPPKRLQQQTRKRKTDKSDIDAKLKKADEKRKV